MNNWYKQAIDSTNTNTNTRIIKDKEGNSHAITNFIKVCAYCKQMQDINGEWFDPLEEFVSLEGERITHGMCPSCFDKEVKRLGLDLNFPQSKVKNSIIVKSNLNLVNVTIQYQGVNWIVSLFKIGEKTHSLESTTGWEVTNIQVDDPPIYDSSYLASAIYDDSDFDNSLRQEIRETLNTYIDLSQEIPSELSILWKGLLCQVTPDKDSQWDKPLIASIQILDEETFFIEIGSRWDGIIGNMAFEKLRG